MASSHILLRLLSFLFIESYVIYVLMYILIQFNKIFLNKISTFSHCVTANQWHMLHVLTSCHITCPCNLIFYAMTSHLKFSGTSPFCSFRNGARTSQTGALALVMENPTTYVKVIKLDEIFCDLVRSYEQSIARYTLVFM